MDPLGQLKQIKEIIFGPEMDDLLSRIVSLEEKIAAHEKSSAEALDKLKLDAGKDLEKALAGIEDKLDKALKKMETKADQIESSQVKRKELGKLLVNLGEKFLKE